MKKYSAIATVLLSLIILTACSGGGSGSGDSNNPTTQEKAQSTVVKNKTRTNKSMHIDNGRNTHLITQFDTDNTKFLIIDGKKIPIAAASKGVESDDGYNMLIHGSFQGEDIYASLASLAKFKFIRIGYVTTDNNEYLFGLGNERYQTSDMPSDSATYTYKGDAFVMNRNMHEMMPLTVPVELKVDFNQRKVKGGFVKHFDFEANITGSKFVGDIEHSIDDIQHTGKIEGGFYGSEAAEVLGQYYLDTNNKNVEYGVFGANKQ